MSEESDKLTREQVLALAGKIIEQEAEAIYSLANDLGNDFWKCAKAISSCKGLIWTTGVGTSAAVAERFAHILNCCGARSMFLSPIVSLHGHAGVMAEDDLLVAMSRGGESDELIRCVSVAQGLGVTTMAFVHNMDSTLARMCDFSLPIHSPQEHELQGYIATTSTVAFSAMCDAIAAVVWEAKGYTIEAFRRTHPGGAVGRELSTAEA